MRIAHLSEVAGLATAALLLAAPSVTAVEGADVYVDPKQAAPHQQVTVEAVGCITDESAIARAYSDAFATIDLKPVPGAEAGAVRGQAKIFPEAKPGKYEVNVSCDVTKGVTAKGSLTVTGS